MHIIQTATHTGLACRKPVLIGSGIQEILIGAIGNAAANRLRFIFCVRKVRLECDPGFRIQGILQVQVEFMVARNIIVDLFGIGQNRRIEGKDLPVGDGGICPVRLGEEIASRDL